MDVDYTFSERPLTFQLETETLCGILHSVSQSADFPGVLLIVGGPQYRVGSHRQFVLLSRYLAERGVSVLRFDYRGMGDSSGELRDFQAVTEDIRAALDKYQELEPDRKRFVLCGLCDAASASSFYGFSDERVSGLVLLNPWIRTEAGEAKAYLKHYYLQRLADPEFWRKFISLKWNPAKSLGSMLGFFKNIFKNTDPSMDDNENGWNSLPLPDRLHYGLEKFRGHVLLILSGNDLTAKEFKETVSASPDWREWQTRDTVSTLELQEADHTFSRKEWRDQVATWIFEWIRRTQHS